MTSEEIIEKICVEIEDLNKELEDEILLERYYSQTDPQYKRSLEVMILQKTRLAKLTKIAELGKEKTVIL
jgi:hypothetical protein